MKSTQPKTNKLEVLSPVKLAIVPKLKDDSDSKTAKALTRLFTDAQTGMRKIIALGLFAWEVKETKLKHGEFGPWLAANCPKLTTVDSVTGKAKPSRALQGYMALTQNVLESAGFPTMEKYLATTAKCANDAHLGGGKYLLIADKKVPDDLKEVHGKICELVDGKTQRALFMEFKQAEDDEDGVKVKHGRVKGQGGATKEQREQAALREEEERLTELQEELRETILRHLAIADAKSLGQMPDQVLRDFADACDTASGFAKRTLAARKGGTQ